MAFEFERNNSIAVCLCVCVYVALILAQVKEGNQCDLLSVITLPQHCSNQSKNLIRTEFYKLKATLCLSNVVFCPMLRSTGKLMLKF